MTKGQVLREALNRLYIIRSTKSDTSQKTREEDWLESIIRILINYSADDKIEIPVDLAILNSYNVFNALLDKVEDINGEANI